MITVHVTAEKLPIGLCSFVQKRKMQTFTVKQEKNRWTEKMSHYLTATIEKNKVWFLSGNCRTNEPGRGAAESRSFQCVWASGWQVERAGSDTGNQRQKHSGCSRQRSSSQATKEWMGVHVGAVHSKGGGIQLWCCKSLWSAVKVEQERSLQCGQKRSGRRRAPWCSCTNRLQRLPSSEKSAGWSSL